MNLEDRLRAHLQSTEVDSSIPSAERIVSSAQRRTNRRRAGGAIAAAVVVIGGVVGGAAVLQDSSVVDVAAGNPEATIVADTATAAAGEAAGSATGNTSAPLEAEEAASEPAPDAVLSGSAFGDRPLVIGVDGGFVGLQRGAEGVVALRSDDGLVWSETPTVGFPADDFFFSGFLAHDDGVFAVAMMDAAMDGETSGSVATSSNLVDWTVQPLERPNMDSEVFVQGIAVAGSNVVLVGGQFAAFVDPVVLAVDLGLLDESAIADNCGIRWDTPEDPIEIVTCDNEPLLVVKPGEPGFDELYAASQEPGDLDGGIVVWSGSVEGPFSAQELSTSGFASPSVFSADGAFVLFDENVLRRSADGVTWSEEELIEGQFFQGAQVGGAVHGAQVEGGVARITSVSVADGTVRMADVPLPGDISFGWVTSAGSGPAGAAILVTGTGGIEGIPDPDDFPESVTMEVDGYTFTVGLESGPLVVTAPDGTVVHDLIDGSSILDDAQDRAGVARFDGADDEVLVILDPETGEDLFSITQDEFFDALGLDVDLDALEGQTDLDTSPFESQPSALLFSRDGLTWELIEGLPEAGTEAFATIDAVGDDEVLVRIDRILDPPDFVLDQADDLTDEQLAELEAWEQEQLETSELIRIPLG